MFEQIYMNEDCCLCVPAQIKTDDKRGQVDVTKVTTTTTTKTNVKRVGSDSGSSSSKASTKDSKSCSVVHEDFSTDCLRQYGPVWTSV